MSELLPADHAKNMEDSALRGIFGHLTEEERQFLRNNGMLYSHEEMTRRIDGLEQIIRILLDRLSDMDNKRLIEVMSMVGTSLKAVEHDGLYPVTIPEA